MASHGETVRLAREIGSSPGNARKSLHGGYCGLRNRFFAVLKGLYPYARFLN